MGSKAVLQGRKVALLYAEEVRRLDGERSMATWVKHTNRRLISFSVTPPAEKEMFRIPFPLCIHGYQSSADGILDEVGAVMYVQLFHHV